MWWKQGTKLKKPIKGSAHTSLCKTFKRIKMASVFTAFHTRTTGYFFVYRDKCYGDWSQILIVHVPKGYEYIPFHAILSTDLFLIFRPFDSTRASTARQNDCLRWRWINLRWFLYSYAPSTISKEEIEGLWTGYFQALFPETALLLISGQGLRKRKCFRASTNSSTRSLGLHVCSP